MKGRIVSINECEGSEVTGWLGYREILVSIEVPVIPHTPLDYTPDWREIQAQQSPFSSSEIDYFEGHEKAMKRYRRAADELDAFHIGEVEITQTHRDKKEVSE